MTMAPTTSSRTSRPVMRMSRGTEPSLATGEGGRPRRGGHDVATGSGNNQVHGEDRPGALLRVPHVVPLGCNHADTLRRGDSCLLLRLLQAD